MDVIERTQGKREPLLPSYRTRILDGNHLGETEHHLNVLRGTPAGALPGHALVLLAPEYMVITEVIRCEDAQALFAFCVAVCSYNLLAAVQGALRGARGEQKMEEVSNYFLTDEINTIYAGMMVAVPPEE